MHSCSKLGNSLRISTSFSDIVFLNVLTKSVMFLTDLIVLNISISPTFILRLKHAGKKASISLHSQFLNTMLNSRGQFTVIALIRDDTWREIRLSEHIFNLWSPKQLLRIKISKIGQSPNISSIVLSRRTV